MSAGACGIQSDRLQDYLRIGYDHGGDEKKCRRRKIARHEQFPAF